MILKGKVILCRAPEWEETEEIVLRQKGQCREVRMGIIQAARCEGIWGAWNDGG